MTLERRPLTIENALDLVIGGITIERAVELTGKSKGYLRSLSHPANRFRLSVDDAVKLDTDFQAIGGDAPIYRTYGLMLEAARADAFADALAIQQHSVRLIKEAGEALAAFVEAGAPSAGRGLCLNSLRELEQAGREIATAIALVKRRIEQPP